MSKIDKAVQDVVKKRVVHDPAKLKSQQEYYKRLLDKGIAKKQDYDLKPLSVL